jgi:hypothetical protein
MVFTAPEDQVISGLKSCVIKNRKKGEAPP